MAKQTINLGVAPTGQGGDTPRSANVKIGANFDELYGALGASGSPAVLPAAIPVEKGGTGGATPTAARAGLGLGTAATRYVGTETGQLIEKGAYGLGSVGGGPNVAPNSSFTQGFYTYGATAAGAPLTNSGGSLITTSLGGNFIQQLAITIPGSVNNPWFGIRHFDSVGSPGSWCKIYHTGNTTIGSGGALSVASPVVRIAHVGRSERRDLQEQSFEPAGDWAVANSEAAGVVIERTGVGEYKITGSLGLALEGWRIQDPCSPDGGRMLGITESEQDERGVVTVRLYKQRWTLDDEGEMHLGKGVPLDVPLNTWIDVRLQMPQPVMEVPTEVIDADLPA